MKDTQIMEHVAPTIERMRKGDRIEVPIFDQSTRRAYHRSIHKFEDLYQNGKINEGCFQAGNKLMRHYYGSLGINVSSGDGVSGEDCMEFPQSYHAQMLAKAKTHVGVSHVWNALIDCVEEKRTLQQIGTAWKGNKQSGQAYCLGLALVSIGLEQLSVLWGFSQSYHDRNPPSR